MNSTKPTIRRFLADHFLFDAGASSYRDDDSFMALHLLDSMGFMELVAFLEAEYGIRVGDDEMVPANLDSLDAIDAFVARKRSA
jgi:acyl carrier protein